MLSEEATYYPRLCVLVKDSESKQYSQKGNTYSITVLWNVKLPRTCFLVKHHSFSGAEGRKSFRYLRNTPFIPALGILVQAGNPHHIRRKKVFIPTCLEIKLPRIYCLVKH
jgi:hypothetical protein